MIFSPHWSCSNIPEIEPDNESWSFVTFGDVKNGYGIYGQLAKKISEMDPPPKLALCLGDILLKDCNDAEWLNFWRYSKPLTDHMPLYIVRGNHEGNDDVANMIFREQTGITRNVFYFSLFYSNTCFIILDTYERNKENSIGEPQLDWLKNQLDSITPLPSIQNIFILMHHPVFPRGKHENTPMKNGDEVHGLLNKYHKIEAVFAGHDHLFNKYIKDNVTYITTGGGGTPLHHGYGGDYYHFLKISFYKDSNRINVKSIGLFNEVLEDFDL